MSADRGSGRNGSDGFRRAISAHFASAHREMNPQLASYLPQRYYTPVRGEPPSWIA